MQQLTHRIKGLVACMKEYGGFIPVMCLLAVLLLSCRRGVEHELAAHWVLPVPHQGNPPASYTDLEKRLDPQACGTCHIDKFTDWSSSAHSRAFSKGLVAQLPELDFSVQKNCLKCHTPLSEQIATYFKSVPETAKQAGHTGITCAGCHVRAHTRYGPGFNRLPENAHGGATTLALFRQSEFCSPCHQFGAEQTRVAGKLLQDVYAQWLASPQGRAGTTCQNCHMPESRHLWRGIGDSELVEAALERKLYLKDGKLRYSITNSGAGHLLPAYSVPEIVVNLYATLATGSEVLCDEFVIAWQLSTDLRRELSDTRLAPGHTVERQAGIAPDAARYSKFSLRTRVRPKAHYARLFARHRPAQADAAQWQQTLAGFRQAEYSLREINFFPGQSVSVPERR